MGVLDLQLFRLHYHLHLALFSLSLPTTTLLQEWAGEKNKTHILILLQFCVTQSHVKQRAIAKKSSLLSQHETPHQLLNATGRSWSCGFKGTEQRMKGDSSHHFLARAACPSDPFSKSHFSLTIESFKLLLAEYL